MNYLKVYKILLLIQGIYTLVTAFWALFDIDSFMNVTGPKTDIWLVKTVAIILSSIGLCLLLASNERKFNLPVIILAMTTAAGLACIDFYYTSKGTISWIYLADGIMEVIFVVAWLYIFRKSTKKSKE